jgi:cytochrome bd ubiquinol oxidase subunit I
MDALWARSGMAMSLAFHIVFASAGIALPVLMVISEWRWRRTGDREWEAVTKAWAKGAAVLFAVGAVSGTVLSFELGLLFPGFMKTAGAAVGLAFSLEGFAFFTEAIFLGVYLYGWDKVRPSLHLASGVIVALSGLLSALFVTMANAWMNAPRGFRVENGQLVDVDPIAALLTPFAAHELLHMVLAAYMAVGFAGAAIHALALLRNPTSGFHRKALTVTLALAVPCSLLQPLVGHFSGQQVARYQPMKLAAAEGLIETRTHAPVHLGPIAIPSGLSILAGNAPSFEVKGLQEIPRADWPHPIVRTAFQIMVLIGLWMAAVSGLVVITWLRKREIGRRLLQLILVTGPLGIVAIEAGWTVTEVGRQPWVIYQVLRTIDTVTPMKNLWVPFATFCVVYLGLSVAVLVVIRKQVRVTL